MHILIIALHRPTKPTGVCRYAVNLAQCLAKSPEVTKVTFVVGEWQEDYFRSVFSLESAKINVVKVTIPNRAIARNLWYFLGLPKLDRIYRPDIIHLSFPIPFFRFLFLSPIAATIHDVYPYEYPENFGYPQVLFNRLFLNQCVQNSDGLSCVSQATLTSLNHYFPRACVRKLTAVAYNYVDFSQVKSKRPSFVGKLQFPFLLCVAQHRKNKNLDLLLHAFAKLKQVSDHKVYQLVIVGSSGPETESLTNLIDQLSLQNQVLLVSAIEDGELSWLYQNCQLFVIPSSIEGFCIPLAEALYFACRVVCSDIPVFREVGSQQCTYFNLAGDTVTNLHQAISDTLSALTPALEHSDNRFAGEHTANSSLRLYSSLTATAQSVT